ncbi:MAG: hypothetical protein IPP15_00335 [Saprospiraceae bacterium]|uniref:Uncharacterized protein n=1 Tax=Candidatus Opimibacter skivensis TaxID=2982028 RepID=A0A9D7SRC2_9BACT|nr:hypothetical protein [Candidatus Opimibacter skivensis]
METHTLNEARKRLEPLSTQCAFCSTGTHSSNMEDNRFSPVYRIQDRTNLLVYRNVKFNEIQIGIPRCERCRKVHSNVKLASDIAIFFGVLLVFIIPVAFAIIFNTSTFGMIVMLIVTVGLVYLGVRALEKGILSACKVISEKDGALEEPLVREFLKNGWSLDRPRA